ncbi:MAG TPA: sigma-70 family RNA polymerase sigma factor [Planctomycetota bacterium]|nr:sigma-70 family RNA polymerase sigma factor [Planctomycetota bacterium]
MTRAHRQIDRQFATFCRTGDPAALGQVFDSTAGELLHIAVWLCGNRTDAEDLLQRTFVQAIELRASFDPSRQVLPWLVGLLGNLARHLLRERARRLPPRESAPVRDPAADAADSEFVATVRARVAAIDPPYREVLALHLEQGLQAKEIAERLGRPAGTVRTQLVRALELLRKRLPSGFVAGLLPGLTDAGALASVKSAVLAAAKGAVPVAAAAGSGVTATAVIGGIVVSKQVLFAVPVLALLLGLTAFLCWPATASQLQPTVNRPVPVAAAVERTRDKATADVNKTQAPERSLVTASPADAADPGFASLHVVVRWQHDGTPAVGVGVSAFLRGDHSLRRDGVTGGDGACTLLHLPPGRWQISSSHTHDGKVVDCTADEQSTVELSAQRQATVRGTVVDDSDRLVADARIWLADGRGPDDRQYEVARSDQRGWFAVPVFGRQLLGARKAGHAHSLALAIDAAAGDCEIVLRMRGAAADVHGVVSGPDDKPIAWARVQVGPCMQLWGIAGPFENLVDAYGEQVVTAADGAFAFDDVHPGQACIRVWAAKFAPHQGALSLATGRNEALPIRLDREAVVAGTVRDAEGKPVAGASIRVAFYPRDLWACSIPSTQSDAAGHFELHGLPAGVIQLLANKDRGETKAELRLNSGASTEWNPTLDAGRHIRGVVFAPDGTPMAGVELGCFVPNPRCHPDRMEKTDAAGRFTLVTFGDTPVTVMVGDILHEPIKTLTEVASDTDDLEIRITHADLPTGSIQGRFLDEAGNPVVASIELSDQQPTSTIRGVKTDATGAFTIGPMRPGRRELSVTTRDHCLVPVDPVEVAPDSVKDLGTIVVPTPGRVTFAVLGGDGKPLPHGNLWVHSPDSKHHGGMAEIENGKATIEAIAPGHWRVIGDMSARTEPAEFEIHSGATAHVELRHRQ